MHTPRAIGWFTRRLRHPTITAVWSVETR